MIMRKLIFAVMLILSISINLSCSAQQNAIKGYEWLEGEWEGYVNDDWGKIIITPSTYKMVYCFSNKSMDEIASAEEVPISIGNHNSYIVGNEILALDKDNPIIGIDVKTFKSAYKACIKCFGRRICILNYSRCGKGIFGLIHGYFCGWIVTFGNYRIESYFPFVICFFCIIPNCLICIWIYKKIGLVKLTCFSLFSNKLWSKLVVNLANSHFGNCTHAGNKSESDCFYSVCTTFVYI